jgi:hypothetical protein
MKTKMPRISVMVLLLGFLAGCATAAPPVGTQRADGPKLAPPGSSWVIAERNSGSYGSETRRLTIQALGEETWQGQKARALSDGTTKLYVDPASGRWIARARGTTPVESFDPPLGWEWPIFVGKSWVTNYRYTDHERGRSFDNVQAWLKVDAYEDVTVPAGTFKAFRVSHDSPGTRFVSWWSPELGISVKSRAERHPQNYLGPGVREVELVSHDIKR